MMMKGLVERKCRAGGGRGRADETGGTMLGGLRPPKPEANRPGLAFRGWFCDKTLPRHSASKKRYSEYASATGAAARQND